MSFDILENTVAIDEATATSLFDGYDDAIVAAKANPNVKGIIDLLSTCSGSVRLFEGDLSLDSLHLTEHTDSLFVDGNLTVSGLLVQDFRAGFLVVFGNLSARDIATTAHIFVTGDLTVQGTLYGNCTNFDTTVLGHTRAKNLVSAKEHYFCLYGGRSIPRIVDVYGDTPNLADATDGESALVPGTDSGFDEAAVVALLEQGQPILLPSKKVKAS